MYILLMLISISLLGIGCYLIPLAFFSRRTINGLIDLVLGILVIVGGVYILISHEKTETHTKLVSLNDDAQTSGSFFLGSGSVGTDPVYYSYIETEQGYKRVTILAKDTYIQEGYETPILIEKCDSLFGFANCSKYAEKIIQVPEGTVIKEISLDNKNGD